MYYTLYLLGNSACVDTAYVMDGSGVSSDNTDHSTSVVAPSTKRVKLYVSFVAFCFLHFHNITLILILIIYL